MIVHILLLTLYIPSILTFYILTDAVVRTSYYKYFHPKECLISNGVLNRAISQAAGKNIGFGDEENNAT